MDTCTTATPATRAATTAHVLMDAASKYRLDFAIIHRIMVAIATTRVAAAPSSIIKELQRVVAVASVEKVYTEPDRKKSALEDRIYELYHGRADDADNFSLLQQLLSGSGQFTDIFDKQILENNEVGNDNRREGHRLVLKHCYSRLEGRVLKVGAANQAAITLKLLTSATKNKNSTVMISGRTLFAQANSAYANCKKALAHAGRYLHGGELPSRDTLEDFYNHILDKLWQDVNAGRSLVVVDGEGGNDAVDTSIEVITAADRPLDFLPVGWFAFLVFGPFSNQQSDLLPTSSEIPVASSRLSKVQPRLR